MEKVSVCRVFHKRSMVPRYKAFMPLVHETPEEASLVELARKVKEILVSQKVSAKFDWSPPCGGEYYYSLREEAVWYEPLTPVERQEFRFGFIES